MADQHRVPKRSVGIGIRALGLATLLAVAWMWASAPQKGETTARSTAATGGDPAGVAGAMHSLGGATMGTTYNVKVVTPQPLGNADQAALSAAVDEALTRVDGLMSTYKPHSELSRFNRLNSTNPFALSADTVAVFARAFEVYDASGGAFDVTVGALVGAWGFGPQGRAEAPLAPARLRAMLRHVGMDKLHLDQRGLTLAKRDPSLSCDLSAIAKGFGVDVAANVIESLGYQRYMVEVGGEVRARGHNADGEPWRIGIERPTASGRSIFEVIPLRDMGMATSGDYRNYYVRDGKRLSHTIDPRTGRPVEHNLASVTVLHPQAALADAWATALEVLGPEAGRRVAQEQGLAAFFIVRRAPDDFARFETPAFTALRANGKDEGGERKTALDTKEKSQP